MFDSLNDLMVLDHYAQKNNSARIQTFELTPRLLCETIHIMDPNVQQQPQQPIMSQPIVQRAPQNVPPLPKILLTVLGVIIVLGLIGGAYYLGTRKNATIVSNEKTAVVPSKSVTVIPTSIVTPTQDITANWKIYTDTSNGLYIKYPTDWSYDISLFATLKTVFFGPGNYKIPLQTEARPPISLTIKGEQYTAVVKRYTNYYDGSQIQLPISFGGLSGMFISGTSTQPGPGQGLSGGAYVLNKNGTAIEFSYNIIKGVDYKNIAQQMIPTLKVN